MGEKDASNTELKISNKWDIARFSLSAFSTTDTKYIILKDINHFTLKSGNDIDLLINQSSPLEIKNILEQNNWVQIHNHRYGPQRSFFKKLIGLNSVTLDITFEPSLFSRTHKFTYTKAIHTEKHKNLTFLAPVTAVHFHSKKNGIRNQTTTGTSDPFTTQQLKKTGFLAKGLTSLKNRITKPKTITISFIGLDGSGKGTYLNMIRNTLSKRRIKYSSIYLGYSQYKLPILRSLERARSSISNPHLRKLIQLSHFAILPIEFAIRRSRGPQEILLTDRHPAFEPAFGTRGSGTYNRLISRLAPKPSLVIYLTGDCETIWNRKKEQPFEQFKRKHAILESAVNSFIDAPTIKITTTKDKHEVYQTIEATIDRFILHDSIYQKALRTPKHKIATP